MQPLTFADRLDFAPTRARNLFARRSAIRLAFRAHQLRLRRWTVAAPSAGMGPEAMPRQLRWPWSGGFVALARAAGVDRIELGCAPQISATCSASAARLTLVVTTAAAIAA
ncbi:MAG: hypothetical protein JNK56_07030 [Myxococcales bacterium]|nr:hypothetical protein [Myxococcales bacterium]